MLKANVKIFKGSLGQEQYTIESETPEKENHAKNYLEKETEKYLHDFLNMKITQEEYTSAIKYTIDHCYIGNYYAFAKVSLIPFSFRSIDIAENEKKTENIKVNENNIAKINTACKLANGKAKVRLLDYGDVITIASDIIRYLKKDLQLSKKDCADIVVYFDNSEKLPKAYKYQASGTQVKFYFNKNGDLYIEKIYRSDTNKYSDKKFLYQFTDHAKNQIIKNLSAQ